MHSNSMRKMTLDPKDKKREYLNMLQDEQEAFLNRAVPQEDVQTGCCFCFFKKTKKEKVSQKKSIKRKDTLEP